MGRDGSRLRGFAREREQGCANTSAGILQLFLGATRGDGEAHGMKVSAAIAEQGERGTHIRGDGRDEIGEAALMRSVQVPEHLVADRAILFRKTIG